MELCSGIREFIKEQSNSWNKIGWDMKVDHMDLFLGCAQ